MPHAVVNIQDNEDKNAQHSLLANLGPLGITKGEEPDTNRLPLKDRLWATMRPTADALDSDDSDEECGSSRSSPRSPPGIQPRPCVSCQKTMTVKRCTACGVCPMCSPDCQTFYGIVHNGTAACCYHMAINNAYKTSPLDQEVLGDLVGGPTVIMGGTLVGHNLQRALPTIVSYVVNQLHIDEANNTPLTMHAHVAATLVSVGEGSWSRGMMRIGQIPNHVAGTLKESIVADEHRLSARLLEYAGKLAVAQSRSPGTGCPTDIDVGHIFVLARVVRIPKKLGASFEFGLQFDLTMVTKIRNMDGETLRCTRYGGGFRPAVAVYKLNGQLHAESGFPTFHFPGPRPEDHVLMGKELCNKMKPLLPSEHARAALNIQSLR